jgi:hypothetical protein
MRNSWRGWHWRWRGSADAPRPVSKSPRDWRRQPEGSNWPAWAFGRRGDFTLGASSGTFTASRAQRGRSAILRLRPYHELLRRWAASASKALISTGRWRASVAILNRRRPLGPQPSRRSGSAIDGSFLRNGQPLQASLTLHAAPRAVGPLTAGNACRLAGDQWTTISGSSRSTDHPSWPSRHRSRSATGS